MLLLVLSSLGIRWVGEHFGMQIDGVVSGAPIGHISPVTSAGFVLMGVSLLTLLSSYPGRRWLSAVAFGIASLMVCSSVTLVQAYLFGTPMIYSTTIIPPSLPTSLGFLLLGTSLLIPSGQQAWPRDSLSDTASRRTTYIFIMTFILLAAGIITTAFVYLKGYERRYRAQIEDQLSAIAGMKKKELANWRQDYLKNAAVLFKNTSFHALTQRYFENPGDADAKRQLEEWIGLYPDHYFFDQACLIDTQGVARMSLPAGLPNICSAIREDISKVLRSKQIELKDFYYSRESRRVELALLIPILDETDRDRPLGVLALQIDPTILSLSLHQ